MVGLGAQTHNRSTVAEIHPNTLRLIQVISERGPSIGVRGFYTAETLSANGISNVEVLGCPSLYTMLKPPISICKSLVISEETKISVNFSRRVSSHSFNPETLRIIENNILKLALSCDSYVAIQDEIEEGAISDGDSSERNCQIVAKYFSELSYDEAINFFKSRTKYFNSFDVWSKYMTNFNYSIGSRLHGNLVALLNGIPSLTIAHDSRTFELLALTGAPFLNVGSIKAETISVEYLKDSMLQADFSIYLNNMKYLFKKYITFLESHNLPHNLKTNSNF